MVRAGLAPPKMRQGRGPLTFAPYVPAASVGLASLLASLPIVASSSWFPNFGFLMLLGWRLLRDDPWPSWWAAPLGLINDLFTGDPLGYSVALWSATMIALDLIDRRTMWRDYWIEWMLAAGFIAVDELLQWRVAEAVDAAPSLVSVVPPIVISILAFPIVAWTVGRLDRWRLGR
jgi:rod shape-determining protein MreD